ncbi:MAG TPA: protoheme IX farnesyltransferase [Maritimibacter sp.]|nr:protoheme IX farnesyltransferase [Maritimibacter sp.]
MTDISSIPQDREAGFGDYVALLKPRVMSLVVFTALVGMLVAPVGINPFVGMVAILFIAIGGGASGALNMWWDADIDAKMRRTQKRPTVTGAVPAEEAKVLGFALSGISVIMLFLATNWVAAALLAFTIFFYVVIYTMWLKRWTPQNIVIGGAAGAFPPMIGWAAVTGDISVASVLMFALTFAWTPPHFWSLALFVKSDYKDAGVPMLTVTHGRKVTRNHILGYSFVLGLVAIALGLTSVGGPTYMAVAVAMNLWFIKLAIDVFRRTDADSEADGHLVERKLFKFSLLYLFVHFGMLLVEHTLTTFGLGGW